jgi:hypothetical protein
VSLELAGKAEGVARQFVSAPLAAPKVKSVTRIALTGSDYADFLSQISGIRFTPRNPCKSLEVRCQAAVSAAKSQRS